MTNTRENAMTISPQRFRVVVGCALVLALAALSGCGGRGGKNNFSLSGKVTYKGEPVTGGTLTLTPNDGKSHPVNTEISSTGTYLIVPPMVGDLKVSIETESIKGKTGKAYNFVPPGAKQPDIDTSKLVKYRQIPSKYASAATSDLKVTVVEGKNEKNFDLTD